MRRIPVPPRRVYRNPQNEICQPRRFYQLIKKVHVSPNRLSPLGTDDNNNVATTMSLTNPKGDPMNLSHNKRDMGSLAPPIYVKNISNYSAFNKVLINITNQNGFTCRSMPSHIIIKPAGRHNFNRIIDHLRKTTAGFHSRTTVTFVHTGS
jgi:hypothetical protein